MTRWRLFTRTLFSVSCSTSPAWWGFTSVADKQRLEASIRRAVRSGLYAADDPSFSQLVEDMDDNLFTNIRHNPHHVLYKLLPGKRQIVKIISIECSTKTFITLYLIAIVWLHFANQFLIKIMYVCTLCLKKRAQLWNGIARNFMDRFWWYLAEIFKSL